MKIGKLLILKKRYLKFFFNYIQPKGKTFKDWKEFEFTEIK